MDNNDPFITIPLTELLDLALNYGAFESQKVSPILAEVLSIKKQELCSIQTVDREGNKLEHPRVWRKKEYLESAHKWELDKARSAREREERFILQANVFRIAETLQKECELTKQQATIVASELLKKGQKDFIKKLGVKSLIASISEL